MYKKLLQKKWLVALLIFCLMALVIIVVLRLLTPAQPTVTNPDFVTTNPDGSSTAFNNIRFEGTFTSPVESLPLATVRPSQTTLDQLRNGLIEQYQLRQAIGVPGLWQSQDYTLSYNEIGDEFLFYKNFVPSDLLLGDTSQAIRSAENFVATTFADLSLTPLREQATYFQGLAELEEATAGEAVALEIPFVYAIEGIPVYLTNEATAPITVLVNSFREVQKVVFQPQLIEVAVQSQRVSLLDLGIALDNINNRDQASIVSAFETESGVFSLDQVAEGTLTEVSLEYRADLETGLAYPFYRFSGELINQAGQLIQAEIITPAVATR
jgi:hypothetical protein